LAETACFFCPVTFGVAALSTEAASRCAGRSAACANASVVNTAVKPIVQNVLFMRSFVLYTTRELNAERSCGSPNSIHSSVRGARADANARCGASRKHGREVACRRVTGPYSWYERHVGLKRCHGSFTFPAWTQRDQIVFAFFGREDASHWRRKRGATSVHDIDGLLYRVIVKGVELYPKTRKLRGWKVRLVHRPGRKTRRALAAGRNELTPPRVSPADTSSSTPRSAR
jgi:hypothetical protein